MRDLRATFTYYRDTKIDIQIWRRVGNDYIYLGVVNGQDIPEDLSKMDGFIAEWENKT